MTAYLYYLVALVNYTAQTGDGEDLHIEMGRCETCGPWVKALVEGKRATSRIWDVRWMQFTGGNDRTVAASIKSTAGNEPEIFTLTVQVTKAPPYIVKYVTGLPTG